MLNPPRRTALARLAAGSLGLLAAASLQAQEVTLKVHHFLAPTSNIHENLIQPWCAKVQGRYIASASQVLVSAL